jgi:Spy/CpxP family protein refolding chaperone
MRISPYNLAVSSFALALAMSVSAAAQSSAPSSPQQSPAQAAPPSQSAPPSAAQPSSPSTAPSSGQAQANEENPLNLTEDQKAKLRPIIMEENQQMEALRNDTSMTQEQKIAKANQIRADASPKIKAVLTPEQLEKLAELQRERSSQQQQQSQPAPPNSSQAPPPPQK